MNVAYPMQKFQDWFTQQWVIIRGRKIDPAGMPWLMGPFGNLNGTGEDFIKQLAEQENLTVNRNSASGGLLGSIHELNLPEAELSVLSENIKAFYETTSRYNLEIKVRWNPVFRLLGVLINRLFSNRLMQLYIPAKNIHQPERLKSEIITLSYPHSNEVKYTVWFRTLESTGQVIFSGVYGTCRLPSGKTCVKAIFPLPNGNATVIMVPGVENNTLRLDSSGKQFGDAGFYFLLKDARNKHWAHYVKSFHDTLTIGSHEGELSARQRLTLWNRRVVELHYKMEEIH